MATTTGNWGDTVKPMFPSSKETQRRRKILEAQYQTRVSKLIRKVEADGVYHFSQGEIRLIVSGLNGLTMSA